MSGARPALPDTPRAWHRRVWALAGPIILSNLSVPLVGIVDTAVVGRLPDPAYIGAVAVGAVIFNLLYWGFGFLRMGTTGLVAQSHGAGDTLEVRATLARALLLACLIGLVLLAVQAPVSLLAFGLMDASEHVETLAGTYFSVRIWSAPATLANYAVLGFLIGGQNTRAALVVQLTLNVVNVLLDLVFVLGLGLGVGGVALASVLAEYTALAVGLWTAARMLPRSPGSLRLDHVLDGTRLRAMVQINTDIFVRTICLLAAFFTFTATGARIGDEALAVNAVLLHLQHLLSYGLDGFAHAAEALVGSAIGARSRRALGMAVRATSVWALVVAAGYAAVFAVAGMEVVGLLTTQPGVRAEAAVYLPWLVLSPLVSVWSFQLDGIFIGATRTAEMRNGMLLSLVAYLVSLWLLVPVMGNHGLWAALMLFMVARAATLGLWYRRIPRALEPDPTAPST